MRAAFLLLGVLSVSGVGCAGDSVENTAYRRLLDRFDSYDQCLEDGDGAACYQTLTLCHDGSASMDLDNRPQVGTYIVDDTMAIAKFSTTTVVFDLETATSNQLPGRHSWELATPIIYACTP